jgi:hypothetical protein
MTTEVAALGLVDDRLRRLHAYWLERRGSRAMPARADIDPLDFPYILGWVMLVEVEPQPGGDLRFRYRLHGANVVEHSGLDLTGRYTEDFPGPEFAAALKESYTNVVRGGVPRRSQRREYYDDRYYELEALLLPLGDSEGVKMLLIGLAFGPWISDDKSLKW